MLHTPLFEAISNFITLSEGDKIIINEFFTLKKLEKHEFLLTEGQICNFVGYIQKGVFRYFINQEGEEKNYAFGTEHQFISNYESLIPQVPSSKNIQALEKSEVFVISYSDLQNFYQKIPQAERFGRKVIEQVFIETLQDLESFYTDTETVRYEKFLSKYPGLEQRIAQYHIASYVGIKPQSLSRIRKRLSR